MGRHKQVNIVIYESSAHGGCYKYALELFKAYKQTKGVNRVSLLLPRNAEYLDSKGGVEKILLPDNKQGKKWHFLWRQFANPWLLFCFLKRYSTNNMSRTFVLLNDFEQTSAPIWAPLFKLLLSNCIFGVFLHDADRDAYPPFPRASAWCMIRMMSLMDIALYHGTLPDKSYYTQNKQTKYLQVVHGLYQPATPDNETINRINDWRENLSGPVFIIPGHIRAEKNYEMAINAIAKHPTAGLIIAGSAANSNVSTKQYKQLVQSLNIADRLFWLEKYLTEEEMTAAIKASDTVLLYYSSTFNAQSGILNQVAPLQKPVITGQLNNALTQTVAKYNLGWIIEADNQEALTQCLAELDVSSIAPKWSQLYQDADWNTQTRFVISELFNI